MALLFFLFTAEYGQSRVTCTGQADTTNKQYVLELHVSNNYSFFKYRQSVSRNYARCHGSCRMKPSESARVGFSKLVANQNTRNRSRETMC